MKNLFYTILVIWVLTACTTDDKPSNIQILSKKVTDCAADGVGCMQFNPDLLDDSN